MIRLLSLGAILLITCTATADPAPTAPWAVIDMDARVRTDPPKVEATGKRLPYGAVVVILEEKTVDGKGYVKVQQKGDPKAVFGWVLKTNLGSLKEFDPAMAPGDAVDTDKLKGLDLVMGSIYNVRGKYLHDRAKELGASAAALAAVLKVESGGRGFGPDGRAIVRFENHVFWSQWGKANKEAFDRHFKFDADKRWQGHQWRKAADEPWAGCHKSQTSEWDVIAFAKTLDKIGALKSASYGSGQIMGFNHKGVGFATVEEMVEKFDEGIKPQLDATIAFIKGHPKCLKGLREKDYTLFAEGYNGTGKATEYGARIKEAADSYLKVTKDKQFGG